MIRNSLTLLLLVALAGCASTVSTDYNPSVVFGNFNTWAFAEREGEPALSLDGARIEEAITQAMNRKTLEQVPPEEADLLVYYGIETVERLDTTGLSYGLGFGRGPFGFGFTTAPPIREIEEGKLYVELVDSENDRVVWRAISKRYLNEDQSPQTRRELIDESIAEMFEKYPPGV